MTDPEKSGTMTTEVISSSSSRITDKKLEGITNFQQWKKIVKFVLTGRNQHIHLTGTKPANDANWDVIEARLMGQLLNSMESNIVDLVTHIDTVKELWEYLDVLYSGQNNISRIYELSQEFHRSESKGRSIDQYFADFNRMYEELNALLPISSDAEQMRLQREQLVVMNFLGGLGPAYDAVRSQILGGQTIASLRDTYARVLRVSRGSSQNTATVVNSSALVSQYRTGGGRADEGNRGGYNSRGGRGGRDGRSAGIGRGQGQRQLYGQPQTSGESSGGTRTCHYCGKPGHIQKFCYKLHGRPGQQPQFANATSGTDSLSIPQSSQGNVVVMSDEEFAQYNQSHVSQSSSSTATLV
ncbi:FAD-binding PCMH-type domain-containing protein [Psidium guajava]|nr:FAD-binding PCMH-type domain-containing protein [Psidium guajava]